MVAGIERAACRVGVGPVQFADLVDGERMDRVMVAGSGAYEMKLH
jgi:hypothetical protein